MIKTSLSSRKVMSIHEPVLIATDEQYEHTEPIMKLARFNRCRETKRGIENSSTTYKAEAGRICYIMLARLWKRASPEDVI